MDRFDDGSLNVNNLFQFSAGKRRADVSKPRQNEPETEPGLARYGVTGLPLLPAVGRVLQDQINGTGRDAMLELDIRRRLGHDPDLTAQRFALEVNRLRTAIAQAREELAARGEESGFTYRRDQIAANLQYAEDFADCPDFGRH